jgi:hypothetical protein
MWLKESRINYKKGTPADLFLFDLFKNWLELAKENQVLKEVVESDKWKTFLYNNGAGIVQ